MTSPNRLRMLDRIDLAILDALQKKWQNLKRKPRKTG